MITNLQKFVDNLPPYVDSNVYSYIIPECYRDTKTIHFTNKYGIIKSKIGGYNMRYDTAYDKDGYKIRNKKGQFLSRITKKNGKHRYYITTETFIPTENTLSMEPNEWFEIDAYHEYDSKYVGKKIEKAMLCLFCSD